MASTYGVRELYGGAMTVDLPVEWIDSSDIREIPDHQEVFLSPTTLTSIIFEINTYVHPTNSHHYPSEPQNQVPGTQTTTSINADGSTTTTTSTSTSVTTSVLSSNGTTTSHYQSPSQSQSPHQSPPPVGGALSTQQDIDAEAAKFHFADVISPPDSLVSALPTPQPVKMIDPSLAQFPAYVLAGNINTVDPRQQQHPVASQSHQSQISHHPASGSGSGSVGFPTTGSSQSRAAQLSTLTHQIQLLIRLPQKGTDLVVRVAVPLKEIAAAGERVGSLETVEAMIKEELDGMRAVLARVMGTLSVREWGLFDG